MANFEESSPFLPGQKEPEENNDKKPSAATVSAAPAPPPTAEKQPPAAVPMGWTADGLPVGSGVMGEPVLRRAEWDTSLCACLGRNDDFCSSDLEVCEFSI